MFKKIEFKGLNYKDLERLDSHDLKRDKLQSFYQTFDFLDLIKKWPEIIGPVLSKVTSPLKISGDTLIIISKHSSYSQNISFLSEEIKVKIFSSFPALRSKIKRISFLTQESYFREAPPEIGAPKASAPKKLHPQDPRYKILKLEAQRLFEDVEDEELKNLLTSIYMQTR